MCFVTASREAQLPGPLVVLVTGDGGVGIAIPMLYFILFFLESNKALKY